MATALKDKLVTLEDLKSLYDAVDSRLGGVEENMAVSSIKLTMNSFSGVTWGSENEIRVIKTGNLVQVLFNIDVSSDSGGSGSAIGEMDVIAVIPAGYRPAGRIVNIANRDSGSLPGAQYGGSSNATITASMFTVEANGNVYMFSLARNVTRVRRHGSMFYIAAS